MFHSNILSAIGVKMMSRTEAGGGRALKRRRVGDGASHRCEDADPIQSNESLESDGDDKNDDDGDALARATPCDTLVALQLLKQQAPPAPLAPIPVIIAHQLYDIIRNCTLADRELDRLRSAGTVLLLPMPCKRGSKAVIFRGDYVRHLQMCAASATPARASAINRLVRRLRHCCNNLSLRRDRLEIILRDRHASSTSSVDHTRALSPSRAAHKLSTTDVERTMTATACIDELLAIGALVPCRGSSGGVAAAAGALETYWLAVPGLGLFLTQVLKGRKEVVQALKRTRFKEMLRGALEKKKLRYSKLDMRFHVRDAIGAGLLVRHQTTSGQLLRLGPDI